MSLFRYIPNVKPYRICHNSRVPDPKPLGRPPLGDEKRVSLCLVKATPDEAQKLRKAAKRRKLPLAAYLRRAGLGDL